MARIRSIKPEFFKSEDVAALPMRARLLWIGLWVHCDNYGRAKDNLKLIKSDVWPLDPVSLAEVEEDLATLAEHGRIVRYEVDGRGYLAVVNWDRHQPIARPGLPKHPAPPDDIPNMSRHDSDATVTRHARVNPFKGTGNREQGGDARTRASPPTAICPKHPNGTTDPCGPCKQARLAAEKAARNPQPPDQSPRCDTCGNRVNSDYHQRLCEGTAP